MVSLRTNRRTWIKISVLLHLSFLLSVLVVCIVVMLLTSFLVLCFVFIFYFVGGGVVPAGVLIYHRDFATGDLDPLRLLA